MYMYYEVAKLERSIMIFRYTDHYLVWVSILEEVCIASSPGCTFIVRGWVLKNQNVTAHDQNQAGLPYIKIQTHTRPEDEAIIALKTLLHNLTTSGDCSL